MLVAGVSVRVVAGRMAVDALRASAASPTAGVVMVFVRNNDSPHDRCDIQRHRQPAEEWSALDHDHLIARAGTDSARIAYTLGVVSDQRLPSSERG
jgi:hypothetical protein